MTIIRASTRGDGGRLEGQALFADGRQARMRDVRFEIDERAQKILIEQPDAPLIVWPIDTLRKLPDQADAHTALTLTSTQNPLSRFVLTDEQEIAMLRFRANDLDRRPPVRGKGRLAMWAAGAIASVALIIFVLVPLMADQLAKVLPVRGERALGEATLGQIQSALGDNVTGMVPFCTSPEGNDALDTMLSRISGDGLGLPYPVNVSVLDHEMVNAFALPGGQVVFFRGMLEAATDPDQIAAVLAHEIGHVAARDPTRGALRSAGSLGVLGLLFGDFAGGAVVLFMVEQLIQADYTREAEAAADDFGIRMLQAADVNPAALGDLFDLLREEFGEASGLAAHFASHPTLGDRLAKAREAGRGMGDTEATLTDAEWQSLKTICE